MGDVKDEEGVPEGEGRWRDEGGSGESTHFHRHGWTADEAQLAGTSTDADAASQTLDESDGATGVAEAKGDVTR